MGIGGAYERELRSVLAGEEKGVRAITRSCNETERAQAMQICQRPFLVVRAPGRGSEGTGDLFSLSLSLSLSLFSLSLYLSFFLSLSLLTSLSLFLSFSLSLSVSLNFSLLTS